MGHAWTLGICGRSLGWNSRTDRFGNYSYGSTAACLLHANLVGTSDTLRQSSLRKFFENGFIIGRHLYASESRLSMDFLPLC